MLKNLATSLNSELEIMKGREKAENGIETKKVLTVNNFDFMPDGEGGKYVVLTFEEDEKNFYFGGSVVTEKFLNLAEQMGDKEWEELSKEGLPIMFEKRPSKKKVKGKTMEYMTCKFYPEEEF